jgi:endonuclease/exonuclease/phosphatase family metal-dependent hydrolase
LLAVHSWAGDSKAAFDKRQSTLQALLRTYRDLRKDDRDVVAAGDFNTSGCKDCAPAVSSEREIALLGSTLREGKHPLTLYSPSLPCSIVRDDGCLALDHFVVSADTREVPKDAQATLSGYCERAQNEPHRVDDDAADHLSDHCPVLFHLTAADLD